MHTNEVVKSLYKTILSMCDGVLPVDPLACVDNAVYINKTMSLLIDEYVCGQVDRYINMYQNAKEVFDTLNESQIPYVCVKGFINAHWSYPDVKLRRCKDIDILVPSDRLEDVSTKLRDLGYQQGVVGEDGNIKTFDRKAVLYYLLNTHQIAPFAKVFEDNSVVCIDVNCLVSDMIDEQIDVNEFISGAIEYQCGKTLFRGLPLHTNAVHTILHCYGDITNVYQLYKRKGYRIKEFLDIYGMVEKFTEDTWRMFEEIVTKYKVTQYVCYVLHIVATVFFDESLLSRISGKYDDNMIDFYGNSTDLRRWQLPINQRFIKELVMKEFESSIDDKTLSQIKSMEKNLRI